MMQLSQRLKSLLTDRDSIPYSDEEIRLIPLELVREIILTKHELSREVAVLLAQKDPFPFKGRGAAVAIKIIKEIIESK